MQGSSSFETVLGGCFVVDPVLWNVVLVGVFVFDCVDGGVRWGKDENRYIRIGSE